MSKNSLRCANTHTFHYSWCARNSHSWKGTAVSHGKWTLLAATYPRSLPGVIFVQLVLTVLLRSRKKKWKIYKLVNVPMSKILKKYEGKNQWVFVVLAEANSFLTWFEGKVNGIHGIHKEWSKESERTNRRGLLRGKKLRNVKRRIHRVFGGLQQRKITVSFLLLFLSFSPFFLVFSWLTMALRSAVHKMPVLLLLLLFTSLLIHITRHLQWSVWKARTWRWENTEQNRMAKNDGEKGRIRKRAMITNYGVFLLCTCLIDWEKELVDERENKNRCNLSHHITIEDTRFVSRFIRQRMKIPLEPERAGYWDQSVYTTQYG